MNKDYPKRYQTLEKMGKLGPNWAERCMGLAMISTIVVNMYYKYESETAVFMLNPCHVVTYCYCIICFAKFNKFTEIVFIISFAFNFGG